MTASARRISRGSLPETISIFPLEGALLLPRAKLPLNIFEPRYLAMVDDALQSELRFIGMIQPRCGEGGAALFDVGCAGRITSFSETDDGRYLIVLSGVARFKIIREVTGFSPFRSVRADWSKFGGDLEKSGEELADTDRQQFVEQLRVYLEATNLNADWDALSRANDETLVNALAMMCPFSAQEKQALLEAPDFLARKQSLQALMQFAIVSPNGGGELQ